MLSRSATVAALLAVAVLLCIGLTSIAQAIAVVLVYFLLCAAIFSVAKGPSLAVSLIIARIVVVAIAVLYVQPFLEVETGTDAQMYHAVGLQISHSILTAGTIPDPGEVWGTNSYAVFTGVWYALFGASQLRIMLFNSLLAAIGSLMFYQTFVEYYGKPNWIFKALVLFDPSVLYWSSIHGKDPLIFFCLGLMFRSLSRLFRAGGLRPLVLYFLAVGGMFLIRPQVALLCGTTVLITLIILRLRSPFRNPAIRICFRLSAVVAALSSFVLFDFYGSLGGVSGPGMLEKLSAVVSSLSFGGTAVDIPTFYTWTDLAWYLPLGALIVLFRPFPWEVGNTFIRLAGLDQLLLTCAFLLVGWGGVKRLATRAGIREVSRKSGFSDPLGVFLLVYCLGFVLLYGVISGNVGTLVREKIQVGAFAWCAAFALNPFLMAASRRREAISQVNLGSPICDF
ncbi:MAG: glycosyltransferase family 39 protein [Candidatus Acidiferrum sp.]